MSLFSAPNDCLQVLPDQHCWREKRRVSHQGGTFRDSSTKRICASLRVAPAAFHHQGRAEENDLRDELPIEASLPGILKINVFANVTL